MVEFVDVGFLWMKKCVLGMRVIRRLDELIKCESFFMNSSLLFGVTVGSCIEVDMLDIQELTSLTSLTSMYDDIRDLVSLCLIGSSIMI